MNTFRVFFILLVLFIAYVAASFDEVRSIALRPRNPAPLFTAKAVIDDKFITINLSDFINQGKWVVLLFYPYDHTFVCPVSMIHGSSVDITVT